MYHAQPLQRAPSRPTAKTSDLRRRSHDSANTSRRAIDEMHLAISPILLGLRGARSPVSTQQSSAITATSQFPHQRHARRPDKAQVSLPSAPAPRGIGSRIRSNKVTLGNRRRRTARHAVSFVATGFHDGLCFGSGRKWHDQITTAESESEPFSALSRQLGGPSIRNCAPSCARSTGEAEGRARRRPSSR